VAGVIPVRQDCKDQRTVSVRSFFDAFSTFAYHHIDEGDAAAAKGHKATARDCYLRGALLLASRVHQSLDNRGALLKASPIDRRCS
jgi:hypothetical protein